MQKNKVRILQWSRSKTMVAQDWRGGVDKKGNKQIRKIFRK